MTLSDLLTDWLDADHSWRPSTISGYRSVANFLHRDPLGTRRAVDVAPTVMNAATATWRSQGWPDPTIWARVRVIRSALGWAYAQRIVDIDPLGPPRADVRMHAPVSHVRAIIEHAARDVSDKEGEAHPSPRLHRAEPAVPPRPGTAG